MQGGLFHDIFNPKKTIKAMGISAAYATEMNNLIPIGNDIRIAILDDDEDDFFIIEDYIKGITGKRFIVDWYGDYESAMEQIRQRSYDLYFVDYFLGNNTGLDLLREAAAMNFDKPIILLTGFGNRAIDISAMENGATDYLVKTEINTEKLERCIRYSLERAHFLEQLKAREAKYRNLFENSKDGVFIADTSFHVKEANPVARLLLQSQNGDWRDCNLFQFIEDEVQKARINDLLANGGNMDDLEIKLSRGNEEPRICLLSLSVQNENAGHSTVHGIIRDITNIKKAQWVSLQAEKMAANERLIRMLTHEIRNPLNNIILSADQLSSSLDSDDSHKDFLAIIQRNSLRINQIISELLNLASPAELSFDEHDLGDVLKESLERAADRLELHKIKVEKNFPSTPMYAKVDKNKLVIAFTNILINAIEAMEPGKGMLRVALHSINGNNTISIRDNGKGIPKEFIARLFDPFFTLKQNGVGLGLTAAYSIFQSHKASVHVESKEGEGTLFMVSLNNS
jgi:PAS domain S-box-containing protein